MSHYRTDGDWLIGFVEFLAMAIVLGPVFLWLVRHWEGIQAMLHPLP